MGHHLVKMVDFPLREVLDDLLDDPQQQMDFFLAPAKCCASRRWARPLGPWGVVDLTWRTIMGIWWGFTGIYWGFNGNFMGISWDISSSFIKFRWTIPHISMIQLTSIELRDFEWTCLIARGLTITLWLCQNSNWKWPFIVDFPIENGDFP